MNEIDRRRDEVISRLLLKAHLRGRIDAKCCECIYDPYQKGNWRQQVQACTAPTCPLYDVRPVSRPEGSKHD